jgi:hypothetical protein
VSFFGELEQPMALMAASSSVVWMSLAFMAVSPRHYNEEIDWKVKMSRYANAAIA